jgi:hypothetical protein
MNTTTPSAVHPFELAGLGKAPFRYIGLGQQDREYGMVVTERLPGGLCVVTQPGGTCEYCGMAIIVLCNVESADGKRFHVGSDCIRKVDAALVARVDRDLAKRRKVATMARASAKLADLAALLADETARAKLATQPHPNAFMAQKGETLLGWAEWSAKNAGAKGRAKALATVRKAIA